MGNVFVGVDIGSSGVRAVLFNPGGEQVFMACQEYPIASPKQGWAELDPEKVFDAHSGSREAMIAVHAAEQGLEISGYGQ
jgi:sugar (pentulose or hexulose) kinase